MTTFARTDTSVISRWWWTVDRWTLGAVVLLAGLGIVLTMAASPAVAEHHHLDAFYFARRQGVYLPLSLILMLVSSLLSPKGIRRTVIFGLIVSYLATIATLFFGAEVKGATRWLSIAGQSVQPSEFLKPAFAVASAWLISQSRLNGNFYGYVTSLLMLAAVIGILGLQPDVGTSLLILCAWTTQIFLAGCPIIVFIFLGCSMVAGAAGTYFLFSHVRERVDHFLDPSTGDGYQINRAMEAFQAGGLFGRGPGEGHVKEMLPDAHADFIFAVAGEEFGLIVCMILICLFGFIVIKGLIRALQDEDLFVVLAVSALLALFGAQALMNMASTMHLIPPKGTTLPFVSYGGSSTLALAWTIGMVLALTRKRPRQGVAL